MTRYILIFATTLIVLFTLELLQPIQAAVIIPFTTFIAQISAGLIGFFDDSVISFGKVIQSKTNGFAVSIEAGCNGVEAVIVLAAAIMGFPASWKQKLGALIFGFFAIQIMNLARIITLFYLGQWHHGVFEWFHLYIWPVLIMLDVLLVFWLWIRYLSKRQDGASNGVVAG
jgi:exosortase H (IPTLxxWG-CTERM-specific)